MAPERWIARPDCDLLHRLGEFPEGAVAVEEKAGAETREACVAARSAARGLVTRQIAERIAALAAP